MSTSNLIQVYGTNWCPDSLRSVRLLRSQNILFEFIDIETNESGRRYVESVNHGFRSVPTIVFPNGIILVEPSNQELLQAIATNC